VRENKKIDYQKVGEPIEIAKENFRINCFLKILDTAIISVKRKFETYETRGEMFVFI
jgi:hypothetical protein